MGVVCVEREGAILSVDHKKLLVNDSHITLMDGTFCFNAILLLILKRKGKTVITGVFWGGNELG